MARQRGYCFREVMPFTSLVSVECTNVAMNTLYKAAVANGLNFHVYMAYGYAISSVILLPLAFIFHRKTPLPSCSIILLGKFFILGSLGMEKLKPTSISSQAKVMGALVSIAGALVVVLYNGPLLISDTSQSSPAPSIVLIDTLSNARSNWIITAACYAIASIWYIFQCKLVREYPAEFALVFFYNFFAMVLAVPVGIAYEPHWSSWKIPPDIRLLSIIYSGVMGSGYDICWVFEIRTPCS